MTQPKNKYCTRLNHIIRLPSCIHLRIRCRGSFLSGLARRSLSLGSHLIPISLTTINLPSQLILPHTLMHTQLGNHTMNESISGLQQLNVRRTNHIVVVQLDALKLLDLDLCHIDILQIRAGGRVQNRKPQAFSERRRRRLGSVDVAVRITLPWLSLPREPGFGDGEDLQFGSAAHDVLQISSDAVLALAEPLEPPQEISALLGGDHAHDVPELGRGDLEEVVPGLELGRVAGHFAPDQGQEGLCVGDEGRRFGHGLLVDCGVKGAELGERSDGL